MNVRNNLVRVSLFLVTIALFSTGAQANEEDLCAKPVATAQGLVVGVKEPGSNLCAYRGIPYAAPPVGDLRWRPPQPAPARERVLVADSFGPICVQTGVNPIFSSTQPESEDCLYLNILRPPKSGVFPVMVWIHGGGLLAGSGSDPMTWPGNIVGQRDVVVVTINYRLGPFGFLSHPDFGSNAEGISGNFGLLDQVAALRWVRENISAFGGDPENVTIFGCSAGGWSVCNLLATPLANGLFHRAILQSGGCDSVKTREEAFKDGEIFAEHANCSGADIASCLRAKTTEEIMTIDNKARKKNLPFGGLIGTWAYTPMVDGQVLTQKPIQALQSGQFNNVPLLIGSARDEAKPWAIAEDPLFFRMRPAFMVDRTLAEALGPQVVEEVKRLYPYDSYRTPADAATDAIGDMALGCKCFDAAEAVKRYQRNVYYYRIDFDGHRMPHKLGATHGIDGPLLFNNLEDMGILGLVVSKKQGQLAVPLHKMMVNYWVNFAISGDPNGPGQLEWPAYNADSRQRMILDLPPHVEETDNVEKCEFWHEQGFTIVGSLQ